MAGIGLYRIEHCRSFPRSGVASGRFRQCSILYRRSSETRRMWSNTGRCIARLSVNPMSGVYPLHLRREIDRRWLRRSEETVSVRARLKVIIDGLREAAVTHEDDEKLRH